MVALSDLIKGSSSATAVTAAATQQDSVSDLTAPTAVRESCDFRREITKLSNLLRWFHSHPDGTPQAEAFTRLRQPGLLIRTPEYQLSFEHWSSEGDFVLRTSSGSSVAAVRTGVQFENDGAAWRYRGEFKARTGDFSRDGFDGGLKVNLHLNPSGFDLPHFKTGDMSRLGELASGVKIIRQLLLWQFHSHTKAVQSDAQVGT